MQEASGIAADDTALTSWWQHLNCSSTAPTMSLLTTAIIRHIMHTYLQLKSHAELA
jgi:hypothetical protein